MVPPTLGTSGANLSSKIDALIGSLPKGWLIAYDISCDANSLKEVSVVVTSSLRRRRVTEVGGGNCELMLKLG